MTNKLCLWLYFIASVTTLLDARVMIIKNADRLEDILEAHRWVVVYQYRLSDRDRRQKTEEYQRVKRLFALLQKQSEAWRGEKVTFVAVDTARAGFRSFARQWKTGKLPAFGIVHDGVIEEDGWFPGPLTDVQLRDFLEKNIQADASKKCCHHKKKSKKRKRTIYTYEQPPYYWYRPTYATYDPYWYWDWPYGYSWSGYGAYGPTIGFGVSFGV